MRELARCVGRVNSGCAPEETSGALKAWGGKVLAGSVILGTARTPIGKLNGALASKSATDLGSIAIAGALERSGLRPDLVDYVIMGQVIQAGQGQVPARQAAVNAGVPFDVPAVTINKVCLSGLLSIHLADLMIQSGEADIVVAGGMESMSSAPHLLLGARAGYRYGSSTLVDSLVQDGLFCAFDKLIMGESTDRYSRAASVTRERQDEIALNSHLRAAASERLAREIIPVEVSTRAGTTLVTRDEGIRPNASAEGLARLPPVFDEDGTITAGNASQLSDGAAALIISSKDAASRLGLEPLAVILGHGSVAGPDPSLLTQPSRAARVALERSGRSIADVGVWEINEAFASVVAASIADLGIDDARVNTSGGAIALGHPLGMSGARLALRVIGDMRADGMELGVAALCGGGGQGEALLFGTAC